MGLRDLTYSLAAKFVDKFSSKAKKTGIVATKMANNIGQSKNALKDLNQQARKVEHLTGLNTKLRKSSTELSTAQQKVKDLKGALASAAKAGEPTKRLSQQLQNAAKSAHALGSKSALLRKEIGGVRSELQKAGLKTSNLTNLQESLTAKTTGLNNKIERQKKLLNLTRVAGDKFASTWKRVRNVTIAGAIGLAGVGAPMLATAANFEQSMSTVGAVTGSTKEQFAQLKGQARELGETTSFSASEAASGMKYLGMAGFKTNEIIAAMPGVLNLAKAGATDLGQASDIASDILSGFGLSAGEMDRVGDVLTKTFTSSNTTLEMLGESMKYVGPIARKFGVSIEDTAAMTGLLGNVGIKGSQAGTVLRSMLTRLAAPSKGAASVLQKLGIETRTASGDMRDITSIIGDLGGAMANMGDGDQLANLKELFGEEPAAGIAELLSKGQAGIIAYADEMRNAGGTSARIAKQMGDNASGNIKAWQSAMESLSITIGDMFLPMLTDAAKWITTVTRSVTGWAAANPGLITGLAALVFGAAGLVSVLVGIGFIVPHVIAGFALIKGAALLMAGGLGIAKGALIALKVIAMANPIGLAIAGIAALAALIITNWDTLGPWFSNLWDGITTMAGNAWQALTSFFSQSPLAIITQTWDGIIGFFTGLPSTMTTLGGQIIDGLGAGIDEKWQAIKAKITELGDMLPGWLKDKLDINSPSRVFAEIGGEITNGVTVGVQAKQPAAQSAVQRMGGALPLAMAASLAASPVQAKMVQGGQVAAQSQQPVVTVQMNIGDIIIQSAPGQDPQQIARQVRMELEKLKHQAVSSARSQLIDGA